MSSDQWMAAAMIYAIGGTFVSTAYLMAASGDHGPTERQQVKALAVFLLWPLAVAVGALAGALLIAADWLGDRPQRKEGP